MSNLISAWQNLPTHLSPILVQIGSFEIRYYGLMYLVAFAVAYALVTYRIKHEKFEISIDALQNLFLWGLLCVVIGGRLGYVMFYDLPYFVQNPLEIIVPYNFTLHKFVGISGISYHGGLIALIIMGTIFVRKYKLSFWRMADLLIPAIPLGYMFGRIGNFLNGELYGRATDFVLGMRFPGAPDFASNVLRHPSQLYEAFFEGPILFAILWSLRKNKSLKGSFLGLYLIGYGIARFFIEFVREPDIQLGLVISFMTMGQILSSAMILAGIILALVGRKFSQD